MKFWNSFSRSNLCIKFRNGTFGTKFGDEISRKKNKILVGNFETKFRDKILRQNMEIKFKNEKKSR